MQNKTLNQIRQQIIHIKHKLKQKKEKLHYKQGGIMVAIAQAPLLSKTEDNTLAQNKT
jgi:hypothetical protein